MAMSRDRVRFKIRSCRLDSKMIRLVKDTLGVDLPACWDDDYITIICRPSQFARFLIERNNRDIANDFKGLDAELFVPEPPSRQPLIIDASDNPARNCQG